MNLHMGQQLTAYRKGKGLTQQQLADQLLVSPTLISKWENEVACPDIDMLSRLADLYRVSIDCLIGREKEEIHCHVFLEHLSLKDAAMTALAENHYHADSISVTLSELDAAIHAASSLASCLILFSLSELPAHVMNHIHEITEQNHLQSIGIICDSQDSFAMLFKMIKDNLQKIDQ